MQAVQDEAYKANTLHCYLTLMHGSRREGTDRTPLIHFQEPVGRTSILSTQRSLSMLQDADFHVPRDMIVLSARKTRFFMHPFVLLRVGLHRWAALHLAISRTSSTSDHFLCRPLNATWRQSHHIDPMNIKLDIDHLPIKGIPNEECPRGRGEMMLRFSYQFFSVFTNKIILGL